MTRKYTPEDILKLGLTGDSDRQAIFEFCDVMNTFSDRLTRWRGRWVGAGAHEPASIKLQARMTSVVASRFENE